MDREIIIKTLKDCGLKVTPQRIAVFDAVINLKNHPTAENITEYIKDYHPNIATGTVYKTLETLVQCRIINKVKTDNDVMRYDAIIEKHHHLYCSESDRIEDFYDNELTEIIDNYLKNTKIPNFRVEDIKLQIVGKFTDNLKDTSQKTKANSNN
ncbi:MAG: transcriptional repressor [Bacteroidales bacterium]|nr:transcriptional repressor [Bacteroidales bacterium]MBK8881616.1 transcriptional repressor [Bacteroidales bacterium]